MDSNLIGYGINDSNGAAYTCIGTMIEANESKSYLPILKRESDRKSKQKMETRKERRKGHRATASVLCKPRCLIAKASRGGSS